MLIPSKIQPTKKPPAYSFQPKPFFLSPITKETKNLVIKYKQKNVFSLARELEGKRKQKKTSNSQPERLDSFYEKQLIFTPTPVQEDIQGISPSKELSALVDSLIDKLSYVIDKGISKTHIFIGNSSSQCIHQTEITITHYDTAPHSFYIDFLAPEASCQFLASHLACLSHSLEHALPKCLFSLSKPVLNTYSSKIKRKDISAKLQENKKNLFLDENILY